MMIHHLQSTRTLISLLISGIILLIITAVGWSVAHISSEEAPATLPAPSIDPAQKYDDRGLDIDMKSQEGLALAILSYDTELLSSETRMRIEQLTRQDFEKELGQVQTATRQQSPSTNLAILTVLNNYMDVPFGNEAQSLQSRLESQARTNTLILLSEVLSDVELLTTQLVLDFNLARPLQLDPTLSVIDHIHYGSGPSMPSVLATKVYLTTAILTELDPANGNEYQAFSKTVADHLVISGHHFPVDVEVAFEISQNILALLRTNDRYTFLFEAAKTDWDNQ